MYRNFSLQSDLQRCVCNLDSFYAVAAAAALFNGISCFSELVRGIHEGFNKRFA